MPARATLLHNPKAGRGSEAEMLLQLLRQAGFEPQYLSAKEDYTHGLRAPGSLVVAAGGDGTVRKAAACLTGTNVPVAILPLGTANNIATALGIRGSPEELVRQLHGADEQQIDVGVATGPWGRTVFLESAGIGALADAERQMHEMPSETKPSGEDKLIETRRAFRQRLERDEYEIWASIHGSSVSEPCLMCEVFNMSRAGPRLVLVPDANPRDGHFDVVLAPPSARRALLTWLDDPQATALQDLRRIRARHVVIRCAVGQVHVDGEFWDDLFASEDEISPERIAEIALEIWPKALRVLIPELRPAGEEA